MKFNTPKILLSTDITDDSKVIYYRSIGERVKKIAPFLVFDDDPYIIIDDGKLVWVYDAYTISGDYPFLSHTKRGQGELYKELGKGYSGRLQWG